MQCNTVKEVKVNGVSVVPSLENPLAPRHMVQGHDRRERANVAKILMYNYTIETSGTSEQEKEP